MEISGALHMSARKPREFTCASIEYSRERIQLLVSCKQSLLLSSLPLCQTRQVQANFDFGGRHGNKVVDHRYAAILLRSGGISSGRVPPEPCEPSLRCWKSLTVAPSKRLDSSNGQKAFVASAGMLLAMRVGTLYCLGKLKRRADCVLCRLPRSESITTFLSSLESHQ